MWNFRNGLPGRFIILMVLTLSLVSCGSRLIKDADYRKKKATALDRQKKLSVNRDEQLFAEFQKNLSGEEREALEFLYAFMPLSDLADYEGK